MFDVSDDYDFTPTENSKLQSLFNTQMLHGESNASLMYTAPKQPKNNPHSKSSDTASNKPASTVLCAQVITLWKLQEGKYSALGKHGLAIIGNISQSSYEVIIYKEKNNIIVRVKLNEFYNLIIQNDNFSTFYDSSSENWLMKFENIDDQNRFSKEIQHYGGKVTDNINKNSPNKEVHYQNKITEKVNSSSSNEDADSTAQAKANIISRMAKMGQQILPDKLSTNPSTDLSDSEIDDNSKIEGTAPRKFKKHSTTNNFLSERPNQLVQVLPNQNIPNQMVFPQSYDTFGFLIAQNSELKLNLSQMSNKLDSLLQNVDNKFPSEDNTKLKSKLRTVQLQSENLKSELEITNKKYEKLQKDYSKLLEESQAVVKRPQDEIIMQEQREEIKDLGDKLIKSLTDIERLNQELSIAQNQISDLEKTVEIQKLKLKDFENFYEENKNNKKLEETIETLTKEKEILNLKLKDFEGYYKMEDDRKKDEKERDEKKLQKISELIKDHMNSMYQALVVSFDSYGEYSGKDVQGNIAKNIKTSTYKMIQDLQNVCLVNSVQVIHNNNDDD